MSTKMVNNGPKRQIITIKSLQFQLSSPMFDTVAILIEYMCDRYKLLGIERIDTKIENSV